MPICCAREISPRYSVLRRTRWSASTTNGVIGSHCGVESRPRCARSCGTACCPWRTPSGPRGWRSTLTPEPHYFLRDERPLAAFGGAAAVRRMAAARRDFFRAALLGWMMPFAAALSKALSTARPPAGSPASTAPLKSVLRRLLALRLRAERFSDWTAHFSAALMFGTASIIAGRPGGVQPDAGALPLRGLQQNLAVAAVAAEGDLLRLDGGSDAAVRLCQVSAVPEAARRRWLAHLSKGAG